MNSEVDCHFIAIERGRLGYSSALPSALVGILSASDFSATIESINRKVVKYHMKKYDGFLFFLLFWISIVVSSLFLDLKYSFGGLIFFVIGTLSEITMANILMETRQIDNIRCLRSEIKLLNINPAVKFEYTDRLVLRYINIQTPTSSPVISPVA